MIQPERFIETSDNYQAWLAARRPAVTATEVAKAATPAGYKTALHERLHPQPIEDNTFMAFGRDNEPWLAGWVKNEYGIMPNRWLVAAENNPRHLATPDGLAIDHLQVAEIKTGGNPDYAKPPIQYRRQMQWQMRCTGAKECLYVFMHRIEVNGQFVPAWFEPVTTWVPYDEKMIADLTDVADRLLEETEHALIH